MKGNGNIVFSVYISPCYINTCHVLPPFYGPANLRDEYFLGRQICVRMVRAYVRVDRACVRVDRAYVRVDRAYVRVDRACVRVDRACVRVDRACVRVDRACGSCMCAC